MTSRLRRGTSLLLAACTCLALAGCSGSEQGPGGGGEIGYVSGRGTITTVAVADRKPVSEEVSGTTLDGEPIALSDFAGKTVVINVWGSWCADCREEAPALAAAARELADEDVAFLGIDSRNASVEAAQAFVRRFDVPYPSIHDSTGKVLLAFAGTLSPNSIPSTLIIDPKGRVAARVLGPVGKTTLVGLVHDAQGKDRS